MSFATLVQGLIVLTLPWLAIEVLEHYLRQLNSKGNVRSPIFKFFTKVRNSLALQSFSIDRGSLWIKVESTAFNHLPERLLERIFWIRRSDSNLTYGRVSHSRKNRSSTLFKLYDVGILFATFALLASLIVIIWGTFALIGDIVSLSERKDAIFVNEVGLQKRQINEISDNLANFSQNQESSWTPQLKPLIPGLTLPWNHLFPFLLALCITQILHEAGHAICGTLHDLAPIRMGMLILYPLIPGAFVVLPKEASRLTTDKDDDDDYEYENGDAVELERGLSAQDEDEESSFISSREKMRIISAGVWHNALTATILAPMIFLSFGNLFRGALWYDSGAIRIFDVQASSPLANHLSEGAIITQLDDVKLTKRQFEKGSERMQIWDQYLSYTQSQEIPQGWCVPLLTWQTSSVHCCDKYLEGKGLEQQANSIDLNNNLCFINSVTSQGRCFDPNTLIEGRAAERCNTSCPSSPDKDVCIRPDYREELLRITVQDVQGSQRVVLFQGDRNAVRLALNVSPYIFRFCSKCFWPERLMHWLSLTFDYTLTLSVAMALFNMLPLPSLDGDVFLMMLFAYWIEKGQSGEQNRLNRPFDPTRFSSTESINIHQKSLFRLKTVTQIHSRVRIATLALTTFVLGGSIVLHIIESN